jgi:hypothetical protein
VRRLAGVLTITLHLSFVSFAFTAPSKHRNQQAGELHAEAYKRVRGVFGHRDLILYVVLKQAVFDLRERGTEASVYIPSLPIAGKAALQTPIS